MGAGKSDKAVSAARIDRLLRRLGWATTTVSLAAVFLVAASFYLQVRPQSDLTAKARQNEAVERVVNRVEGLIQQVERALLTAQRWSEEGVAGFDDVGAFNHLMIPVLQLRSVVSSVHLASDDGREILLLGTPDGFRNRITDVPRNGTQQQWLSWKSSRVRSGEEWKEQDYDPRKRPWFTGAMATPEGTVHWTPPYLFQTTREPGVTASVRWTDKASGRQFVVAMDVLLSDLSRSTRALAYGENGMVALLTGDGKVLGLPRNSGFDSDEAIQKSVLQPPEAIGLPLLAAALAIAGENLADDTVRIARGTAGRDEPWLVTMQRVPFGNQFVRVAMMAPERDFSPWSRHLVATLLFLLIAVAALSVLLSRRFSRDVSRPIGKVFDELAESNSELEIQGERTAAIADLAPRLQNAGDFPSLAQLLLAGLAQRVALGQGSLYRLAGSGNETPVLRLCGGYARCGEAASSELIALGEGLVGQCAVERRAIRLDNPPAGYLRVSSVLAAGDPVLIHVLPVLNNDQLLGVLELAMLEDGGERDRLLIDSLLPVLALCMEILSRNERTGELLNASLAQSTELAAQQERIQAMLAEQAAIFDNAPMGILYVEDGFICRANAEIAWLVDRPIDDLVGSEIASLFASPQDYRQFNQTIGQRLADGMGVKEEWQLPAGKARSFWALISIQRLPVDGVERAAIWVIEDVSERRRLEEVTRASEAQLRQVLEDSPAAVTMVNENGEQLFVNRRLADMLGVAHALLRTRRSSEFWVDAEERQRFIERLKAEGRIDDYETRFRRADGTEFRVILNTRWVEQGGQRLLLTWMFEIGERSNGGNAT